MQRDDEEAAKVYEEFVKDFGGGDDEPGKKVFVRGGVIQPANLGAPPLLMVVHQPTSLLWVARGIMYPHLFHHPWLMQVQRRKMTQRRQEDSE